MNEISRIKSIKKKIKEEDLRQIDKETKTGEEIDKHVQK